MAGKAKAVRPASAIFWGQDIESPVAIHPPPVVVPYLGGLATGLNGFAAQRRRSIEYYIEVFELDRESFLERRGKQSKVNWGITLQRTLDRRDKEPGNDEYMKPYNINKALTLELMMTCAMFRLLSPTYARANCKLKYEWPINFAPSGTPDIVVDCDGFIVHVEVGAKQDVDDGYFRDELTGTLNHMVSQDVTWALLITEWDYKTARNSQAYKDFKSRRQEDLEGRHLIIMSLQEMAELSATLAFDADFNSGRKYLTPAQVRELFEALHAAQEPKEKKKPKRKKTRKGGKQKPEKEKKVDINLRATWINTTDRLLKDK